MFGICVRHRFQLQDLIITGPELVIASAASRVLCSQGACDFFFKCKLDEFLIDKLKAEVNHIKALLEVAEMRQIQENSIGDEWFTKTRFAICDAEDMLEKIATEAEKVKYRMGDSPGLSLVVKEKLKYKGKNIFRAVNPFKKTREAEMKKIIQRLESIASQVSHFGLDGNSELAAIREMRGKPGCFVNDTIKVCGRSEDKKNIMKLLDSRDGVDDTLRVIPIVGLGGVGKTTLANMIYRECISLSPHQAQMDGHQSLKSLVFDVKIWVCLSDEFKVIDVFKSILETITKRKPKLDGLDSLQQELKNELQDKKFLLILDDYWSEDRKKWDHLRTPFLVGKPGSRIIVTTRSTDVAKLVTSLPNVFYLLNVMSEDESWSLFESMAFPNGSDRAFPALKKIGQGIVDKCKGLPLAIKLIGGLLLSYKNDAKKWKSVLDSEVWSSTSKILPSLWLSYYHLPHHIQQCFAYFSLFPKYYQFQMEEMVMLWVAEGLIERTLEMESHEDVARGYFTHLLLNFFIQESSSGGSGFFLHDLVHDLAKYVSRGLCVDWLNVDSQSRRLSYIQWEDEVLLYQFKVQKLTYLRTFLPLRKRHNELSLPQRNWACKPYLDNKILSDMLSNFKILRVLSLEGYPISMLPASVGDMKLLRYLNISRTHIGCLPSRICHLYELRFLILCGCQKLERLPANIVDLVNLRYLNVDDTRLKEMPDGIGRMKNLQMLSKLVLGKEKSKQMKELKALTSLQGKLQISGLNNITDKQHVVDAQFEKKEYLDELVLDWGRTDERDTTLDERVLDAIHAHENLKELTVNYYGGKSLSTWIVGMTPSSNIMLRSLCINSCFNLETLPPLGNLRALLNLTIMGSKCIKSLGVEFCGSSFNAFPALEMLKIEGMEVLETWSCSGGGGRGFPSLKELRIIRCPMLTEIPSFGSLLLLKELSIVGLECLEFLDEGFYGNDDCDVVFPALDKFEIRGMDTLKTWSLPGRNRRGFPSLKELIIQNCPELMTFPIFFPSLTILQIDECHKLLGPEMCGGPSLGNLPALKDLTIKGLHCLESLNEGFYGDYCSNASFFPALEKLEISEMRRLDTWCIPRGRHWGFASLKELRINKCRQLTKIPFCFPYLTKLRIWECDNLIEIEMFEDGEGSSSTSYGHSLLSINIRMCPKLEEIPKSFVNLIDVYCYLCNKLASFPRLQNVHNLSLNYVSVLLSLDGAIQDSTCLENLEICSDYSNAVVELLSLDLNRLNSLKCLHLLILEDDFERIGWENDDKVAKRTPPNLSYLQISGCNLQMSIKILTHFANLSSPITNLEFIDCRALESLPDVELPSTLQSLKITSCDTLTTISDQFLTGCSKNLRELTIEYCRNLVCLPRSLSTLQSIQKLHLSDCKALESLPDGFHKATSLQILTLLSCPNLIPPKGRGFPISLTHLTIRDCGKMKAVSNLRLTKLTSLTHLKLEGFLETSRLEAGCLPESIEELTITNFPYFESLSGVLPTLKNLKWLEVDGCPLVNHKLIHTSTVQITSGFPIHRTCPATTRIQFPVSKLY